MEFNNTSNEAQDAAIQYFRLSNSLEHSSIRGQFPPSTLHIGTSTYGKKNDKKTWGHRVAHLTAAGQVIDLTGSAREVHDRICVQNAASRIAIGEVGLLNMAYFLHNFEDEADRIALLRKLRESQPESLCIAVASASLDPRQRSAMTAEELLAEVYEDIYTTKLTNLPFTYTSFFTVFPSKYFRTFSGSFALAIASASEISAAISIVARTLPFTCTTIVTVSSMVSAESKAGHFDSITNPSPPLRVTPFSFSHSSSARWGAMGERSFVKVSEVSFDTDPTSSTVLRKIMRALIAVLKCILEISSV